MSEDLVDRYISFCGIECDKNADKLIDMLNQHLSQNSGSENWQQYFVKKLKEKSNMKNDNLHFVGSQVNALFEYFTDCRDAQALELLAQLEDECC